MIGFLGKYFATKAAGGAVKLPFKTLKFGVRHPLLSTAGAAYADHKLTDGAGRSYLWDTFNEKGQEFVDNQASKFLGNNPFATFLSNYWKEIGLTVLSYFTLGKTAGNLALASALTIGVYDSCKDHLPPEVTSVIDSYDPRNLLAGPSDSSENTSPKLNVMEPGV